MRIVLLHLSDLHLTSENNPILDRIKRISETLNLCSDIEIQACFIIMTGDITSSGQPGQYEIAHRFLTELKSDISSNPRIKQVIPVLIPGNHDCNFHSAESVREALVAHLIESPDSIKKINGPYIKQLTAIQDDFFKFACENGSNTSPVNYGDHLTWLNSFKIGNYTINFFCFNTAWMSKIHEEQGKLLFPTENTSFEEIINGERILSISILHHPYDWFESSNSRALKDFLNSFSDVIITGHLHDADNGTLTNIEGKIQEIIQGGVLQTSDSSMSSFNIQVIDLDEKIQNKYIFSWDDKNKIYKTSKQSGPVPFENLANKNLYNLKTVFKQSLKSLDVQISHPKRDKPLEIDDIFVNPALEVTYSKKGIISDQSQTCNNLGDLLKIIKDNSKVIIIGNKYYGKTILLKKIFNEIFDENIIPILCTGKDILRFNRKLSNVVIKDLFDSEFEDENGEVFNKYLLRPISEKAILIDDLYQTQINLAEIDNLLDILGNYFGIIVITTTPNINLQELFDGHHSFIEYTRLTINFFSLPSIDNLIQKWITIGNDYVDQKKLKTIENDLFNTMGRQLIPRNPFFILTILQNMEYNTSPEFQNGAYGYYFQTIINVVIAKVANDIKIIGYIHDYFSHLAFYMLSHKCKKLNKYDFNQLNILYMQRGISLDLESIFKKSVSEEILNIDSDQAISFKYSYYYEYFASKYLADNFRILNKQTQINEIIEHIALNMHKEENQNILMFLAFHSKDPQIFENITKHAEQNFKELTIIDIHHDVGFLNKLSPQTKVHYLTDKPLKETKKEILEANDINLDEVAEGFFVQEVDDLDELSIVNKITYSFASIKVLSQILRKYLIGDLDDRLRITKECYDLGLKTIKYVLNQIENQIPDLQQDLARCIQSLNPSITNDRMNTAIDDWIWYICQTVCIASIKNVSLNVGAPELETVYELILQKYPDLAYKFIDISIRFDHFNEIPERKISDLIDELKGEKNHFCIDLLSLLWTYHIYQFYVPTPTVQKINGLFDLQRKTNHPNVFTSSKRAKHQNPFSMVKRANDPNALLPTKKTYPYKKKR